MEGGNRKEDGAEKSTAPQRGKQKGLKLKDNKEKKNQTGGGTL